MLQWIPGSDRRIIWNDREGDRFVSRILDLESGALRTLPAAIYAIAPDGRTAIGTDFRRLDDMRPGYGYTGIPDPNREVLAPEDAGIYTLDLTASGAEPELVIPVAGGGGPAVSARRHPRGQALLQPSAVQHRRIALHLPAPLAVGRRQEDADAHRGPRWIRPARRRRPTAGCRTSSGAIRRPSWAGPWRPTAGGAFYLHRDRSDEVSVIGSGTMTSDGHCTYLADTDWILNDCYPQGDGRMQELYLYHVPTDRRIDLGSFPRALGVHRRVAVRPAPPVRPRRPIRDRRLHLTKAAAGRSTCWTSAKW